MIQEPYSTFLLIDSAMIGDALPMPWASKRRCPDWVRPLYDRKAGSVSPVLMDIEAARAAGRMRDVTAFANARRPQLHLSVIDTLVSLDQLCEHLRRFIYFADEQSKEYTLRLADCAVLPALRAVLSPAQWAAITSPMRSWKVHGRDGALFELPKPTAPPDETSPLMLSQQQMAALKDAMGVDQLLANLRTMRPGQQFAASPLAEYEMASKARQMWHAAGREDDATLLLLARGAFDTGGKILWLPGMPAILAELDDKVVREKIAACVANQF
jgi:Domain of unknown function (DUF4123)